MSLEADVKKLSDKLYAISEKELKQAVATSLNKTAAHAKSRTVRGVSKESAVKQKLIRQRLFIRKANRGNQVAKINGFTQPIPVISLLASGVRKPRKRGKGIKAGGKHYQGAFINNVRSTGRPQVMRRETSARYPVEVLKVRIHHIATRISKTVSARAMKGFFPRTIEHELKRRIEKHKV